MKNFFEILGKGFALLVLFWFIGYLLAAMTKEQMSFWETEVLAAYAGTAEPAHGLVQTNPAFQGMESGYSSESIHVTNQYGDYGWEVNECWLADFIGAAAAVPNALLDGVAHNDTVASAVNAGDIIIGTAPGWDDLPAGALNDVLTMGAVLPAWAAPVVQTSTLLDGVVHTDTVAQGATLGSIIVADATPDWNELNIGAAGNILTVVGGTAAWAAPAASAWQQIAEASVVVAGADYTARGGGAVVGAAEDVIVVVTCRGVNGGVAWAALSHPTPVADMVTYYWVLDGSANLEVHIVNDSQLDILCTVQYNEL
jgi:hypothetical protein